MERTQDDVWNKPPPPEGYEVPPEPEEPPIPSDQPDDPDVR